MDNRYLYEDAAYDFSENDAEKYDSLYAGLDKKASADDAQKQRVLSSAMRKAGFEMNETQAKMIVTKSRKKRHIKKFIVIAAAAAAMVGTVAATGAIDRVQEYFWQDMSPYQDEIMKTAAVVSNDDITMSVDGVIADEVKCRVVVSVTSKSDRGEDIVKQLNYSSHDYLEDCCEISEKAEKHGDTAEESHEWYVEQVKALPPHVYTLYFENAGKNSEDIFMEDMTEEEQDNISYDDHLNAQTFNFYEKNKGKYHHYMMFEIEMKELDRTKPLILREKETGLSAEIDLNSFFDSHRLVSDDPKAFDYVVISPLAVYIRSTENDMKNGRLLKGNSGEELSRVVVNYKDGSDETLSSVTISQAAEWNESSELPEFATEQEKLDYTEEHWEEQIVTDQQLNASGEKLFDLEKIKSVTIDGVTYTIKD